jgi:hypothetical protein
MDARNAPKYSYGYPLFTIDGFITMGGIGITPKTSKMGISKNTAYTGTLRKNIIFVKDQFSVKLDNLDIAQISVLRQICEATGLNVFHRVVYLTNKLVCIWDGSTSASGATNYDVQRVRNKVEVENFKYDNYPGNMNIYFATFDCTES